MTSRTSRILPLCFALCAIGITQLGLAPSRVRACSPVHCVQIDVLPSTGSLPANAVAFLWQEPYRSSASAAAPTQFHLYALQGDQRVEVAFTTSQQGPVTRIAASAPVAAGTELRLEVEADLCQPEGRAPGAEVMVTEAVVAPLELGTLHAGEVGTAPVMVGVTTGECQRRRQTARSKLRLELSEAVKPYADSLRHALVVDGEERTQFRAAPPAFPKSALGGALEDLIFAVCEDDAKESPQTLTPGVHRVQWLSRLADGTELRSDELVIDLACSAPPSDEDEDDAGTAELGPDAAGDAGAHTDPVDDGESDAKRSNDDGCAVAAPRPWQSALGWIVTLGAAWLLQAKRRRTREKK